jgi:hypothetical protein
VTRLVLVALTAVIVVGAVPGAASAQGGALGEEVAPPFGETPLGGGIVVSPGWSVEAYYAGIAAAVGVLATGIVAVAVANPNDRAGTGFGVASMGLLAIAGPTVALGGASARGHPYVPGARGVRIAAWITWSVSLIAGISLLAADIDQNDVQRGVFMAPVAVGTLSLLLFAFDALVGAVQADLISGNVR